MEKHYQLFYKETGEVKKMNLRATDEHTAKRFFRVLHPECEIVYVTDDPIPMTCEYVQGWEHEEDELLKHLN